VVFGGDVCKVLELTAWAVCERARHGLLRAPLVEARAVNKLRCTCAEAGRDHTLRAPRLQAKTARSDAFSLFHVRKVRSDAFSLFHLRSDVLLAPSFNLFHHKETKGLAGTHELSVTEIA